MEDTCTYPKLCIKLLPCVSLDAVGEYARSAGTAGDGDVSGGHDGGTDRATADQRPAADGGRGME